MDQKALVSKLQNLPEHHKKVILFSILGVLAVVLGSLWFISFIHNVTNITHSLKNIKLSGLDQPVSSAPAAATAGWTTYQNTQYGFSFQYPPTMQIKEGSAQNVFTVQAEDNAQVSFMVSVYSKQIPDYSVMATDIQIGNTQGSAVKENQSQTNPCLGLLVQQNGTGYVLDDDCLAANYQPEDQDAQQTVSNILSSFSLLATTSPTN